MASRGSGVGAIVTIAILGILTLVLFVLTLAFYGQVNSERAAAADAVAQRNRFVSSGELDESSAIEPLTGGKSVFGYMNSTLRDLSTRVTGQPSSRLADIERSLEGVPGQDRPLLSIITDLVQKNGELANQVTELNDKVNAKTAELAAAQQKYETERQRLVTAAANVQNSISGYTGGVDEHLRDLDAESQEVTKRVADLIAQHQNEVGRLSSQITELTNQRLILESQLAQLRGERGGEALRGASEYALVDGNIVGVNASANTVTINRGQRDKIVLGMSFAVYSEAASLRPDAQGNLPRGKAGIEVINVQDTSSVCRIIRETRGNNIVNGDVIVNPVYDPNKKYKFVVYGNFDSDGDGIASIFERDGVLAQIRGWGGLVTDGEDLQGDTDFLVLGERPIVPPEPPSSAPIELRQAWIKTVRQADWYDNLQRKAETTSIPILNLNRLNTLLGN